MAQGKWNENGIIIRQKCLKNDIFVKKKCYNYAYIYFKKEDGSSERSKC